MYLLNIYKVYNNNKLIGLKLYKYHFAIFVMIITFV